MNHIITTKLNGLTLRFAQEKDVSLILEFINKMAEYENMTNEVVATEELLKESLFERKAAEVVIGNYKEEPAGYALFFYNFSTFLGKPGIYLEDLFVKPEFRGKGIGKIMLSFLAKLAIERNCGRLEWSCLDWNKPSIRFYKKLGAIPLDEWTAYRVCDGTLEKLAKHSL